jgi:hypothetical protein
VVIHLLFIPESIFFNYAGYYKTCYFGHKTYLRGNKLYKAANGGVFVGQKRKEIKAVLHLPENEQAIRQFEKKICDFYAAQVEQRLHSLPKEKKLEVLKIMLSSFN